MQESSYIDLRRKIYQLVLKNPGLHENKIADIIKISNQLADYHLSYLEREGLIVSAKEEGYKRYYVKGEIGSIDRKKLSLLRQEIPLKIVLLLLKHKKLAHKEILSYLDLAASTLSYHLKKLLKHDIISYSSRFGEKKYEIKDEKEITNLLIKFKPYSWVDNLTDSWTDFTWGF